MIAFDLDGIFVNDIVIQEDTLDDLLNIRSHSLKPLFILDYDYAIITGRPIIDQSMTKYWFKTFFNRQPSFIFNDNKDIENDKYYKRDVLKANPLI